jgi:hypothetical protein
VLPAPSVAILSPKAILTRNSTVLDLGLLSAYHPQRYDRDHAADPGTDSSTDHPPPIELVNPEVRTRSVSPRLGHRPRWGPGPIALHGPEQPTSTQP